MFLAQIIGAALLLLAYMGLGRWWTEIHTPFVVLNIAGAGTLAVVAWTTGQVGFAVLNSVWLLVAIRSFVALRLR